VKTVDIINSTEKYSKEELESIKYCENAITRLTDMYLS